MIIDSLKRAGLEQPRIAVCGLNPHNGDNGNYGDEEARLIEPGIELARANGYTAEGPFPADTAFVRAIRKPDGYDGVVTMYHDQGQIAMKLLGFERGSPFMAAFPIQSLRQPTGRLTISWARKGKPSSIFQCLRSCL